ncbi:MAG: hypothetical protein IKD70_06945, partial [Eggerthellaceae bacterium]|nr:hypothetical protein [Eggerthellaceae bacterium]
MGWFFLLLFLAVALRIAVLVKPSLRKPLLIGCYVLLAIALLVMFGIVMGASSCSASHIGSFRIQWRYVFMLLVAVAALIAGIYVFETVTKYKET